MMPMSNVSCACTPHSWSAHRNKPTTTQPHINNNKSSTTDRPSRRRSHTSCIHKGQEQKREKPTQYQVKRTKLFFFLNEKVRRSCGRNEPRRTDEKNEKILQHKLAKIKRTTDRPSFFFEPVLMLQASPVLSVAPAPLLPPTGLLPS